MLCLKISLWINYTSLDIVNLQIQHFFVFNVCFVFFKKTCLPDKLPEF